MQATFRMNIKPIGNETDRQNGVERSGLFDVKKGTDADEELEILAIVIDNYENDNFSIGMADLI